MQHVCGGVAFAMLLKDSAAAQTRNMTRLCPEWISRTWRRPSALSWFDSPKYDLSVNRDDVAETLSVSNGDWLVDFAVRYSKIRLTLDQLTSSGACATGTGCQAPLDACVPECFPAAAICKHRRDIVLLNTFPNSGTSWIQNGFEAATGRAAESVYHEGFHKTPIGTFYRGAKVKVKDHPGFVKCQPMHRPKQNCI